MDDRRTEAIRRRYDRIAPVYNLMEWAAERGAFKQWRSELWNMVQGSRILEVGVGTGKNIPYYPPGAEVTAIDFSPKMLARAERVARATGCSVTLRLMDAQDLPFGDATFDAFVSTCVFCSVPDPVVGFKELHRVVRRGGRGYLIEHVLSGRPLLRRSMELVNPLTVHAWGANINRQTRANLEAAGFEIELERDLMLDVMKLLVVKA